MLSKLRRRVLGLVIVVPRLAWRPCPRRNGDADIVDVGDVGDDGELGDTGEVGAETDAMAVLSASVTPLAEMGSAEVASGDIG